MSQLKSELKSSEPDNGCRVRRSKLILEKHFVGGEIRRISLEEQSDGRVYLFISSGPIEQGFELSKADLAALVAGAQAFVEGR